MSPSEAAVDLAEKYERILRLREAHERKDREPAFVEPDPRAEMAALAARWPGSLLDLDRLPLATIAMRLAELARVASGERPTAPWMGAQSRFHALARGALRAKQWLGRRRRVDADLASAFRSDPALDAEAREWAEDLAAIAAPPRGRLLALVYARLARELGVTEAEARASIR